MNGSPSAEFILQRGLEQGNPLAPLLFNIVAEGLKGLLREVLEKKLFKGFLVGRNNVEISILQYVDDAIFFGEASMENVKAIKVILRSFKLVSSYLNCKSLSIPFLYLGIPIGTNPRCSELWDPILKKCERKLAKWKQKHISFRGRVTLIKSVLTSILIYFFLFFRVPNRVANTLVSLQCRFLWGRGLKKKKIA